MSYPFKNFKPESLWKYFYEITQVPRPSKKEEKIRQYLIDFAKEQNLEYKVDEIGNVLIKKPATKGMEDRKVVVLQSHMDMVCEKNNDVEFDFDNDPIQPRIDGDWVRATGTTLGADDGIGMATEMALLADKGEIQHPPLECLFTMDEETGLTGAFGLKPGFIEGDILLNLDSEDEGELYIGCAGGRDTVAEIPYQITENTNLNKSFKIKVGGLKGGHSGDEIDKGLGNAVKLIVRVLNDIEFEFGISDILAGNLRNAIAREAYVDVSIKADNETKLRELVEKFDRIFKDELHITDKGVFVEIENIDNAKEYFDKNSVDRLIKSCYAAPHGVIAWSQDIEDFVETSTNLASLKLKEQNFFITTSQRSSVASALDNVCNMVANTFKLAGAQVKHTDGYPGWTPNPNSEIKDISSETYKKLFNKEPKVLAIHAGLECGLIGETYPNLDMISYGPTIKGAHSPDEGLLIETVKMFWDHTLEILKNIPKK